MYLNKFRDASVDTSRMITCGKCHDKPTFFTIEDAFSHQVNFHQTKLERNVTEIHQEMKCLSDYITGKEPNLKIPKTVLKPGIHDFEQQRLKIKHSIDNMEKEIQSLQNAYHLKTNFIEDLRREAKDILYDVEFKKKELTILYEERRKIDNEYLKFKHNTADVSSPIDTWKRACNDEAKQCCHLLFKGTKAYENGERLDNTQNNKEYVLKEEMERVMNKINVLENHIKDLNCENKKKHLHMEMADDDKIMLKEKLEKANILLVKKEEQLAACKGEINSLKDQLIVKEQSIKQLQKRIDKKNRTMQNMKNALTERQNTIDELTSKLSEADLLKEELRQNLKSIQAQLNDVDVTNVMKTNKEIDDLKISLKEKDDCLTDLKDKLKEQTQKLKIEKERYNEIKILEQQNKAVSIEIKDFKTVISLKEDEYKSLNEKYEQIQQTQKEKIQLIEKLTKDKENLAKKENEVKQLKEELKNFQEEKQILMKHQNSIKIELQQTIDQLQNEIKVKTNNLKTSEDAQKQLKVELEKLEGKNDELNSIQETLQIELETYMLAKDADIEKCQKQMKLYRDQNKEFAVEVSHLKHEIEIAGEALRTERLEVQDVRGELFQTNEENDTLRQEKRSLNSEITELRKIAKDVEEQKAEQITIVELKETINQLKIDLEKVNLDKAVMQTMHDSLSVELNTVQNKDSSCQTNDTTSNQDKERLQRELSEYEMTYTLAKTEIEQLKKQVTILKNEKFLKSNNLEDTKQDPLKQKEIQIKELNNQVTSMKLQIQNKEESIKLKGLEIQKFNGELLRTNEENQALKVEMKKLESQHNESKPKESKTSDNSKVNELLKNITELQLKLEKIESDKADMETMYDSLCKQLSSLQEKHSHCNSKEDKTEMINDETLKELHQKIAVMNDELEKIKLEKHDLEIKCNKLDKNQTDTLNKQEDDVSAQNEIESLKREVDTLRSSGDREFVMCQKFKKEVESLTKKLSVKTKKFDEQEKTLADNTKNMSELAQQVYQLQTERNDAVVENNTFLQRAEETERQLKQYTNIIDELKIKLTTETKSKEELQKKFNEQVKETEEIKKKYENLIEENNKSIAEISSPINNNEEMEALKSELLKVKNDNEAKCENIKDLQSQITNLQDELNKLNECNTNVNNDQLQKLKDEVKEKYEQLVEAESELMKSEGDVTELSKKVSELKQQLDDAEKNAASIRNDLINDRIKYSSYEDMDKKQKQNIEKLTKELKITKEKNSTREKEDLERVVYLNKEIEGYKKAVLRVREEEVSGREKYEKEVIDLQNEIKDLQNDIESLKEKQIEEINEMKTNNFVINDKQVENLTEQKQNKAKCEVIKDLPEDVNEVKYSTSKNDLNETVDETVSVIDDDNVYDYTEDIDDIENIEEYEEVELNLNKKSSPLKFAKLCQNDEDEENTASEEIGEEFDESIAEIEEEIEEEENDYANDSFEQDEEDDDEDEEIDADISSATFDSSDDELPDESTIPEDKNEIKETSSKPLIGKLAPLAKSASIELFGAIPSIQNKLAPIGAAKNEDGKSSKLASNDSLSSIASVKPKESFNKDLPTAKMTSQKTLETVSSELPQRKSSLKDLPPLPGMTSSKQSTMTQSSTTTPKRDEVFDFLFDDDDVISDEDELGDSNMDDIDAILQSLDEIDEKSKRTKATSK